MKSAAKKLKRRVPKRRLKAYAPGSFSHGKKKKIAAKRATFIGFRKLSALAGGSHRASVRHRDRILEKFDRGEDVFEFCDMGAGVMKIPLD